MSIFKFHGMFLDSSSPNFAKTTFPSKQYAAGFVKSSLSGGNRRATSNFEMEGGRDELFETNFHMERPQSKVRLATWQLLDMYYKARKFGSNLTLVSLCHWGCNLIEIQHSIGQVMNLFSLQKKNLRHLEADDKRGISRLEIFKICSHNCFKPNLSSPTLGFPFLETP